MITHTHTHTHTHTLRYESSEDDLKHIPDEKLMDPNFELPPSRSQARRRALAAAGAMNAQGSMPAQSSGAAAVQQPSAAAPPTPQVSKHVRVHARAHTHTYTHTQTHTHKHTHRYGELVTRKNDCTFRGLLAPETKKKLYCSLTYSLQVLFSFVYSLSIRSHTSTFQVRPLAPVLDYFFKH